MSLKELPVSPATPDASETANAAAAAVGDHHVGGQAVLVRDRGLAAGEVDRRTRADVVRAIAGAGAFLFGFAVLWIWIRFMRRLPHLLSHHMAPREGTSEEPAAIAAAD